MVSLLYLPLLFLSMLFVWINGSNIGTERGLFDFLFSPCKCKCGIPNRQSRLLGGEFLKGHEFPWLTLIQINGLNSIPASLINNKYVISAATPLVGLTPYDIKVTLGQYDRCFPDVSSTNISVERLILHPDYSPGNRAHDIALVKLNTVVTIERRISPICLSFPGNTYLGQVATIVGWAEAETLPGVTPGGTTSSCRPRKVGVPVLGPVECLETSESQFVSMDKGCAGIVGSSSPICKVDAGGAVMYRNHHGVYELIGVLTDKNDCGPKPSTALYTNVNDHLLWITQNTKDACYCFKT